MSRPQPYGYDQHERSFTEDEEVEEHSHATEFVMPNNIDCDTLTASGIIIADEDIRTPELVLGSMVVNVQDGAVHAINFKASGTVSALGVSCTNLAIAGHQFVASQYAKSDDVTTEIAAAVNDIQNQEFQHISEPVGQPEQVVIDTNLVVPSVDIGSSELRYQNGQLDINSTINVNALQIDGINFDMSNHTTVMDQHADFFEGVTITDDPGDPDTRVYVYSANQELRSLDDPVKYTRNPGILRVNDHFSVHEPGRVNSIQHFSNASVERPGLVQINVPWVHEEQAHWLDPNDCVISTAPGIYQPDAMIIRQNYYIRDNDGTVHQLSVGPRSDRGISFREMPTYDENTQRPKETTHIGARYSTIGTSHMDAFVNDDGYLAALTIGSTAAFEENKNLYRLCVRGKLICKQSNSGYQNYTLFHCCEQEDDVDASQLTNRFFEWTGVPRVQDPETGASVNDWKSLHSGHALSSVKLSTGYNSKASAGVLHNIAAEEGETEFVIHGAHGDNQHAYHGERPLLRIASSGDHLCWVVQGVSELTHETLSGKYTKYIQGVEQDKPVYLQCNHDMSFTLSEDVPSILDKIAELEQTIAILTGES